MRELAISVQEAASRISVSKSHMHKMVNERMIRSVSLGGRKLIPVEELERFISEGIWDESRKKEAVAGDDE